MFCYTVFTHEKVTDTLHYLNEKVVQWVPATFCTYICISDLSEELIRNHLSSFLDEYKLFKQKERFIV